MMRSTAFLIIFPAVILISMFASGCVNHAVRNTDAETVKNTKTQIIYQAEEESVWPESELKRTFESYWELRVRGDAESTFELEAPYIQKTINYKQYAGYIAAKAGVKPKELIVTKIEPAAENLYNVRYIYRIEKKGKKKDTYFKDRWVKADGKWKHVLVDRLVFPGL